MEQMPDLLFVGEKQPFLHCKYTEGRVGKEEEDGDGYYK